MPHRYRVPGVLVLILLIIVGVLVLKHRAEAPKEALIMQTTGNLQIASTEFTENQTIPVQYTCKGDGVNPPLQFSGVPVDAKSLALIVHDPDAPSGDFTHWLVWDMSPSTLSIAANSVPTGAMQGNNGAGQPKYYPPCPPSGSGVHHYLFKLYALNTSLGLKSGASRDELEKAMEGHTLSSVTLTGLVEAQ